MPHDAATPIELGRAIQRAREDAGLTQAELAQSANDTRRWLIEVERGHDNAQVGKVMALLHHLGLTLQVVPHDLPSGHSELDDIVEATLR